MAWLADFFRLVGGLLYWNARKTLYRLRAPRAHCPCQHPSDSGRAWETGCNAVTHWHEPARFRRVCPLLQQNAEGRWRCSVNQADVRPFWGRALAFYGGGLAALYLLATLATFTALRTTGYEVSYPGVAWPPAWSKFTTIKSDFFFAKFKRAFAAQDIGEAILDLSLAYDFNPQNYEAGLLLAQLCQTGQPGLSNGVYARLLLDHPARSEETAQLFFRALLARGDFQAVQTLARDRILAAPVFSPAWLNAFLFANQRTGDLETLGALAREPRTQSLPPDVKTVLQLAADLRAASPVDARQLLINSTSHGATGYTLYFICRQLITRGSPQVALGLISTDDTGLSPRDRTALRLDALAAQGWSTTLDKEIDLLLAAPPTPVVIELLGTHLIRWPDPALLEKICTRLEKSPPPDDEKSYAAYLTLFCAAAAARDEPRLNWTAARIKAILGTRFASLDAVGAFLLGQRKNGHLENYLPALRPLPLEPTYALFCRYSPAFAKPATP